MFAMLSNTPFRTQDGRPVPLSFSAGLVSIPGESGVEHVMAEADRFLFLAKTNGRGRIVSEADQTRVETKRILLAEDDEQVASIVSQSLGREGFEVVHCRDGMTAYRTALATPCSLWILDLKQEATRGRSLLSDLRGNWRGNRVPVLMMTSLGTDQDLAKGFQLGADDYLVKPFSPYDLMTRVHNLLRK
jgi:PleD family two-component response regulator